MAAAGGAAAKNPLVDELKVLKKTLETEQAEANKHIDRLEAEIVRLRNLSADHRSRLIHGLGVPIDAHERVAMVFAETIANKYGPECGAVDPKVRTCEPKFGDLQVNCAMTLKEKVGGAPKEIAEALAAAVLASHPSLFTSVTVAGPGFINISLSNSYLADMTRHLFTTAGVPQQASSQEVVVIDYSSPNVAKEMHVGHLRSTVIGDALARLFESRGHKVVRQNHIGDWGTQFGMLTQYMIETKQTHVEGKELNALYKSAKKQFDDDDAFKERSRARVVQLQGGDAETIALWTKLVDASRVYFNEVYDMLRVTLKDSDVRGESSYNSELKSVVDFLRAKKLVFESEGATVAYCAGFTSREGKPLPFIVQKGDGGFGYASTDLAAIRHRCQVLKATRILYVVDSRQADHFKQVFDVARRAGFLTNTRAEHIAFGTIMGPDHKPFKTRAGDTVRLQDLINEAVARARETAHKEKETQGAKKATDEPLTPDQMTAVVNAVGVGAIKYFDLSGDRLKDYTFSFEGMLSFEGNTGVYLQYAYTRIVSIFRKAEAKGIPRPTADDLADIAITQPAERAIVLKVAYYDHVVDDVLATCNPHIMCTYLYDLTAAFTTLYSTCPVLKSEGVERKTRLVLCDITARTLRLGLNNLGIDVLDRM